MVSPGERQSTRHQCVIGRQAESVLRAMRKIKHEKGLKGVREGLPAEYVQGEPCGGLREGFVDKGIAVAKDLRQEHGQGASVRVREKRSSRRSAGLSSYCKDGSLFSVMGALESWAAGMPEVTAG